MTLLSVLYHFDTIKLIDLIALYTLHSINQALCFIILKPTYSILLQFSRFMFLKFLYIFNQKCVCEK